MISRRCLCRWALRLGVATGSISLAFSLAQASCLFAFPQANAQLNQVEQKLSQLFTVLDFKNHIYAVNSDYAMQPLFDEKGALAEIQVAPRFTWNESHPEWIEPDKIMFLGERDYMHLLSLIEQVRPLGRLEKKDLGSPYITNDQYPALDEYENVVIRRSMRSGRGLPDTVVFPVAGVHIFFFRLVSGRLNSIVKFQKLDESEQLCRANIDGREYWMARKDCESVKTGHQISVKAAGPVYEPGGLQ